MKPYKMPEKDRTKGVCWRYALACILEVNPKKIPDFVHKHPEKYLLKTREWLDEKYGKGMVFIPINQFMETSHRFNPSGGPLGHSIMIIDTKDEDENHAVIAFNGCLLFDPAENDHDFFTVPLGFFVIYRCTWPPCQARPPSPR